MDGAVVVVERSGALHYARSFATRFDRRHAKSDRLNLAALLFALQNFAGNSLYDQDETSGPPIARFETAAERIVMARSRAKGLLIALFVRPSLDAAMAQSLVRRIVYHYDDDLGGEARLAVTLNQNARIFREACERALQDQVDACLHDFATSLYGNHTDHPPVSVGFVLLQYAPSRTNRQFADQSGLSAIDNGDDDDDDYHDDSAFATADAVGATAKESRLASPRSTSSRGAAEPAPRLQKLFASTCSLLPQSKGGGNTRKAKIKKNAVMSLADPKHFERFVRFPRTEEAFASGERNDALSTLVGHTQFPIALVDSLEPHMTHLVELIRPPVNATSMVRTLESGTWRNYPLPPLIPTDARVGVNLRFWFRDGCFLVHVDTAPSTENGNREKLRAATLLDGVTPLARCAVKLMP